VNSPLSTMLDAVSDSVQSEKSGNSIARSLQDSFDHHTLGIWDLYIEKSPIRWHIPIRPFIQDKAQFISDLGCLWRAICDLSSPLLFARLAVSAGLAVSPAVSLWYVAKVLVTR
jgi:hypothetical protein